MNIPLFKETSAFIEAELGKSRNPAVACSFGKDSMVMLALVRLFKPDVPVIYFERFAIETKHAFAREVAQKWGLNLITMKRPHARDLYAKGDHVEILELYEIHPDNFIACPVEPVAELDTDAPFLCAVNEMYEPVEPGVPSRFDAVFLGHRSADRDIVMGDVPLRERFVGKDGFRFLYPLKDWTSNDIWAAIRRYEVPVNGARYIDQDVAANNDLWPLCTRCLASAGAVTCPKTGLPMEGVANQLNLNARREYWRARFTNLAE